MAGLKAQLVSVACTLSICCAAMAATDPADTHPELHLIPWPKALQQSAGEMRVSPQSRIVVGDDELKPLAEVLASEVAKLTGFTLEVAHGPAQAGDLVLKLNPMIQADEEILMLRNRESVRTRDGAHTIAIDEQAVVEGFDYRATAEGTSTLLQLLRKSDDEYSFPKVTIRDWPHADFCAVMLDVARQDHSINDIKTVVQLCRLYKARYLQLHLTDDQGWTFPSTRYPALGTRNYGAHGGIAPRVYRLDELKELVAYADARGVTIVPEMEVPGHSGAAARALPEIFDAMNPQSNQPVNIGCMNMSNEEIYPALDTLIGEICDVFRSSPYFHIGSDEVTTGRLSLNPGYKTFMEKHNLKDDHELANHFIAEVCALVKKRGKKAIKWEGLSNTASKDAIIMGWELNSTVATEMLARGYTTITVPWTLAVPWEEWNMYVCNGSRLKKGDSVLGAMLVAWEQPPLTHITNLRNLASRQERTWGPDNSVTVEGFAARFQPLDAVAGRLIEMPPRAQREATFTTSMGVSDFLDPVFAFDGNDATFYKAASVPKIGDHFTLTFEKPQSVYAIEVLTGVNRQGQFEGGEIQVSSDGAQFTTVGTLDKGMANVVLKDPDIQSVRLLAVKDQQETLVLRAINLRMMVPVARHVSNPMAFIGEGNVAATTADTEFEYPIGSFTAPVINRNFKLTFDNRLKPCNISGPISGSGNVVIYGGGNGTETVLDGKLSNTMQGKWSILVGRVVLAKESGAHAIAGTIRIGDLASLVWNGNDQIHDSGNLLLSCSNDVCGSLNLNGFNDTFDRLELAYKSCKILTDGAAGGGVLNVRHLSVFGQEMPSGVYTSANEWLKGRGYVIVGDVKRMDVSGIVENPQQLIGAGSIATLKSPTTFQLSEGECTVAAVTGDFPLTLSVGDLKSQFNGYITGKGSVRIEVGGRQPLEFSGSHSNSYTGKTTLLRGELRLNKPTNAIAIPGDLIFGGSEAEHKGSTVIWDGDGQVAPSAVVTLEGSEPCALDLNGHQVTLNKVLLSNAAVIRTGTNGRLHVKQLYVDGKRQADGDYHVPQLWLEGSGVIRVDARVDIQGVIGSPETVIGPGNIGNLTGNTKFGYPSSGGDFDIATNGFTLTLDSGDGNAFAYLGGIGGTGNVEFLMGPSHTGFRDAPMRLAGEKPNTTSGKFLVKKGRIQLEKPPGVDAISGHVIVGGQGFNDCLFWKNSHQIQDTVQITLLDAGNNGAAYLHLNGCIEVAAGLTMTINNKVLTDSADGISGELTVRSLTIDTQAQPAGIYRSTNAPWVEGSGKVIVEL